MRKINKYKIPQISNTEKLNEFYSLEIKTINEFTTSKMNVSLVGKDHLELGDEEYSYESFSISEDANYLAIELTWKNSDFSKIDIYDISNRNKVKKIKTFKNLFFTSHLFEGHTFYYSTVCAKVSKTKKTKSKFVKFCPVLKLTEEFYSIDITGIPSFIEISSNNLYYSFAEETLITSLNKLNLSSLKEETMLDNLTNSAVDSSYLNGFYVSDYNKSYPNGVIYRINPLQCSKKFIHMSFDQSFTLKEFQLDEFNNLYAIGLNEKAENVFKLFNDEGKELVHKNFKFADAEIYSIEGEDITFKLSSMDWIRKLVVYNTRTNKYKTKTFIPSVNSKIKTKYKVIKGVPCIVYEPQNKIDRVIMTGYGGFFDQGHMTYNPKLNLLLDKGYTIVNVILSGDGFFGYNSYINGKNQIFRVSEFATVAEQFKKKNKVFAFGSSNGGLLMGILANEFPHLFDGIIASVGVMDLLNYDKYTLGQLWKDLYGEDKEELLKFSPLHNINKNIDYPKIMIITSDTDYRVAIDHSLKYYEKLSEVTDKVSLQVVESEGHFAFNSSELNKEIIDFLQ